MADVAILDMDVRSADDQLRVAMPAAAAVTLLPATLTLRGSIRYPLRPLDSRPITAGDRGRRLRPDRSHTELGGAALAFDGTLDAFEEAEVSE